MDGYIDFHSHILPGTDHGCANADQALFMLREAEKTGILTMIATPHFYPNQDNAKSFLERRRVGLDILSSVYDGPIKILEASETQLTPELFRLDCLKELCIQGTSILLTELPRGFENWVPDALFRLSAAANVTPLLAHADRYYFSRKDGKRQKHIADMGILSQINAASIIDIFSRKKALEMIKSGFGAVLGSDAHYNGNNPGDYAKACSILSKKLGTDFLARIMKNGADMISGQGLNT